jgi:hypothetical protein
MIATFFKKSTNYFYRILKLANLDKILYLLIFCILASCQWIKSSSTPYFMFTNFKGPDGSPIFQQGFKDGCSTVLYARGTVFYRMRHKPMFNPKYVENSEYNFGHQRGYSWCFQHGIQGNTGPKTPITRAIDPYGYDPTFNRASIQDMGGLLSEKDHWELNYNINDVFSPFKYGIDGSSTPMNNLLWSGGGGGGVLSFN